MKRDIVILVIFSVLLVPLLFVASVPVHELGHVVAIELVGGEVSEVCWVILPQEVPLLGDANSKYWGCVWGEFPEERRFFVDLAGGVFQGIVFFILAGLVLFWLIRTYKKADVHLLLWSLGTSLFTGILAFGVLGIIGGLREAGTI